MEYWNIIQREYLIIIQRKYPGPGPGKSERAGSGTLSQPIWDKFGTKWIAIKDLEAFAAGFYAEFRRESF